MAKFAEKRVVITGAGSGLGRALALRFARDGWRIACTDIVEERADETLQLVGAAGGSGFSAQCDTTQMDDLVAVAEKTQSEWGGVDVLINNAGVSSAGTVAETTLDDWDWMMNINLMGVVRGCKVFLPMLQQQEAGHVVNIASFAAIANAPGMASYNVAKSSVLSLSETLRGEVKHENIGVSVVCPAFFKTNLTENFRGPDESVKNTVNRWMEKSGVTADDVANDIFEAIDTNQFLVISHKDALMQYRLKRLAPDFFFNQVWKSMLRLARRQH